MRIYGQVWDDYDDDDDDDDEDGKDDIKRLEDADLRAGVRPLASPEYCNVSWGSHIVRYSAKQCTALYWDLWIV